MIRTIIKNHAYLILIILVGCSETENINEGISREGLPEQESWNTTIILTRQGSKQAIINAGHLQKYSERQFTILDDSVTVDFFDPDEVHTSLLISDLAEIDQKSDYMRAIGNVVVISDSGVTLFTDTLDWDAVNEYVYTDDSVMITTEASDTLYGVGFESDASLDHWKITQPTGVTERGMDEQ